MENNIPIIRKCPMCGKLQTLIVNKYDYEKWQRGELVQKCFPYLSPKEREVLETGICSECWDNMLKEDGDDEEDKEM